jgi:hypothetical protein
VEGQVEYYNFFYIFVSRSGSYVNRHHEYYKRDFINYLYKYSRISQVAERAISTQDSPNVKGKGKAIPVTDRGGP